MKTLMKRDYICVSVFYVLFVALFSIGTACSNQSNSSSSSNSSTEFTSEQDVIDYCCGKTFSIPYLGVRTTGSSSNVYVKSYSGSIAKVRVCFDMTEILNRAVTECITYEINKETGEVNKIDD
mgnify:CR=1 FL=1